MPDILVINPNSNEQVTENLRTSLRKFESAAKIECRTTDGAPFGIESDADVEIAASLIVEQVDAEQERDAVVIACYSDPGLARCRQRFDLPVFGMQDSALRAAASGQRRFGVGRKHGFQACPVGRVHQEASVAAHPDHDRRTTFRGQPSNRCVLSCRAGAELSHLADHQHQARTARAGQLPSRTHTASHAGRVGVVGVIDDHGAIRAQDRGQAPGLEGPESPPIFASKTAGEVVFTIANGDRAHKVYLSTAPDRFDNAPALMTRDGAFRDRLSEGPDLVYYRID